MATKWDELSSTRLRQLACYVQQWFYLLSVVFNIGLYMFLFGPLSLIINKLGLSCAKLRLSCASLPLRLSSRFRKLDFFVWISSYSGPVRLSSMKVIFMIFKDLQMLPAI